MGRGKRVRKGYSFKPVFSCFDCPHPVDWDAEFGRDASLVVEIGFGMGEVLVRNALERPDKNYVGIELHGERFFKTLGLIERTAQLDNVRLMKIDAAIAFDRFFREKSIAEIYSLFPCPWPKKAHIKNRLFSNAFLKVLNNRLNKHGHLCIVTDSRPYFDWIGEEKNGTGFIPEEREIRAQFGTKFEKKWQAGGQDKFFEIKLKKNQHIDCPVKEDVRMKAHRIDRFDPKKFKFTNCHGEVSVVMKDFLFDAGQERAMIHLIVAEPDLTQHIWVSIRHKNDHWSIACAEGQNFLRSTGVAFALEYLCQTAQTISK